MSGNWRRPFEATTSAWEFEQKRDVARVLADARAATGDFNGHPVAVPGELDWTERVDNADLGFRTILPPRAEPDLDEDDYDEFYGPDGGFWE